MPIIETLFNRLPTLSRRRDPNIAGVVGFLFGGIGLGIYLRSFIDFLFPMLVLIALSATIKVSGVIVGAAIAGGYGYFRVQSSNARFNAGKGATA